MKSTARGLGMIAFRWLAAALVFVMPLIILSFMGFVKPEIVAIESIWIIIVVKYMEKFK